MTKVEPIRLVGLILIVVMTLMGIEVALKRPLCVDSPLVDAIDFEQSVRPQLANVQPNSVRVFSCSQFKNPEIQALKSGQTKVISDQLSFEVRKISEKLSQIYWIINQIGPFAPVEIKLRFDLLDDIKFKVISSSRALTESDWQSYSDSAFKYEVAVQLLKQKTTELWSGDIEAAVAFIFNYNMSDTVESFTLNSALKEFSTIETFQLRLAVTENLGNALAVFKSLNENKVNLSFWKILNRKNDELMNRLEQQWKIELSRVGELASAEKIDYLIDLKTKETEKVLEWLQRLSQRPIKRSIVVKYGEEYLFLPFMRRISLSEIVSRQVKQIVLIANQFENLSSYSQNYSKLTENLIVVKASNDFKALTSLNTGADLALDEQLVQDSTLKFVSLHLPSLSYVLRAWSPKLKVDELINQIQKIQTTGEAIGWQGSEWVSAKKAYRPIAAHEAVKLFRTN